MAGTGYLYQARETAAVGNEALTTGTISSKVIYLPVQEAEFNLNPEPLMRDDELRGVDEPIAVLEEVHNPSWSLTTRAYPDVVGALLTAQLGAPTTTAGDGVITDAGNSVVATGGYRHTWTAPYGGLNAYTPTTSRFIAAYKDQSVWFKLHGAAVNQTQFSFPETGGVGVQTQGVGTYMERVSDPSLTPSYEALTVPPFLRANVAISTWLSGSAIAEGDVSFQIESPVEAISDLSSASRFPNNVLKSDGPVVISGSITKALLDADDYDALKAATGFSVLMSVTSTATYAASSYYRMILKLDNAQYTGGGPESLGSKRRHGSSFDWKATYDGTTGHAIIQVVNATSSYA